MAGLERSPPVFCVPGCPARRLSRVTPSRRDGLILQLAFPTMQWLLEVNDIPDDDFYALVRKGCGRTCRPGKLVLNSDAAYAKKIRAATTLGGCGTSQRSDDRYAACGRNQAGPENAIGFGTDVSCGAEGSIPYRLGLQRTTSGTLSKSCSPRKANVGS